jgi:hypothetical protein
MNVRMVWNSPSHVSGGSINASSLPMLGRRVRDVTVTSSIAASSLARPEVRQSINAKLWYMLLPLGARSSPM